MINFNGDLLPKNALYLNAGNRGFSHGDVISVYFRWVNGRIVFLEVHYFFLMAALRQMRMDVPMHFTMEFLEQQAGYLAAACGFSDAPVRFKFSVFRRQSDKNGVNHGSIGYVLEAVKLSTVNYIHHRDTPFRSDLFKDHFIYNDSLTALPLNNLVISELASIYAMENGLQTCILLNNQKEVCESLEGTLFIRFGNTILAPNDNSGCKHSVLRSQFLKFIQKDAQYTLEMRPISPFELPQADELFALGELGEFRSITDYKKTSYTSEAAQYLSENFNDWIKFEFSIN